MNENSQLAALVSASVVSQVFTEVAALPFGTFYAGEFSTAQVIGTFFLFVFG